MPSPPRILSHIMNAPKPDFFHRKEKKSKNFSLCSRQGRVFRGKGKTFFRVKKSFPLPPGPHSFSKKAIYFETAACPCGEPSQNFSPNPWESCGGAVAAPPRTPRRPVRPGAGWAGATRAIGLIGLIGRIGRIGRISPMAGGAEPTGPPHLSSHLSSLLSHLFCLIPYLIARAQFAGDTDSFTPFEKKRKIKSKKTGPFFLIFPRMECSLGCILKQNTTEG